ncbi:MAG: chorismate-binding protein [Oligoflexia bacterium]|nr:chorismate-binding protein [Oligoflexia bacterium]
MWNNFFTILPFQKTKSWIIYHDLVQGFIYYKNSRLNLITNNLEKYPICNIKKRLQSYKINQYHNNPKIIILSYDFGEILSFNNSKKEQLSENFPLAIELEYNKSNFFNNHFLKKHFSGEAINKIKLTPAKIEGVCFKKYLEIFEKGYMELLAGNCYQFNLTFEHKFTLNSTKQLLLQYIFANIISNKNDFLSMTGAYANITNIPVLNKIFYSNSPECLFKIKKNNTKQFSLISMPIKGSLKIKNNDFNSEEDLKKKLLSCKKNSGELNMITDLLRNDLSSIEKTKAVVIQKKACLKVPNILHQYSVIKVDLSSHCNLFNILKKIFPGGSITGAPKKRVMKIISQLEPIPRGFYTGSTIIFHKDLKEASINIRSATIDSNFNSVDCNDNSNSKNLSFSYGSGGGITLLSNPLEEFVEMNLKVRSFIDYLFTF